VSSFPLLQLHIISARIKAGSKNIIFFIIMVPSFLIYKKFICGSVNEIKVFQQPHFP
jgi:hypothetical protein